MALVKYRYQQKAGVNVEQLQKEVPTTVTLNESHGGAIENVTIDSASVADLDEAMLRRGFVRIGTAVTGYPAEDDDFGAWKETVLHINQLLGGASGGVLQALLVDVASQPAASDTFIITDGVTTETFTFKVALAIPFDVLIGASASDTEANLATAINADSALWSAVQTTNLDRYFSPVAANQLLIYRTLATIADDRVYGTIGTGNAAIQVLDFGTQLVDGKNDLEYGSDDGTQAALLAADGLLKMFGFGRTRTLLRTAESHFVASGLRPYTWDELNETWSSAASSDGSGTVLFGADSVALTTTTRYLYPGFTDGLAQVSAIQWRAPRDGVIQKMRVRHNTPGASANAVVYTFRKNNASQPLTVSLAASGSDGSDLVNSFTVAAGDLIDVTVTKALALTGAGIQDITVTAEYTV